MVTVNIGTGAAGGDEDILVNRPAGIGLRDAVYISGSNFINKATANSAGPQAAIGFVSELPDGSTAKVRPEKILDGFSGLTPGSPLFLSTTAGLITHTAPSAPGELLQEVGVALTATAILIKIDTDPTVIS